MKKMQKLVLIFVLLLTNLTLFAQNFKGDAQLVILHTNDTHGHPAEFPNLEENGGGLAARAMLIDKYKKSYNNVLILDAGDLNTGRPESDLFGAEPDLKGMNAIGYDAMTLGNHEFDKPLDQLKKQMEMASFPFLCANIKYKDGSLITKPYIIKTMPDGFKVGILGLTTSTLPDIGSPKIVGQLIIEDEVEAAKRYLPELKEQCDYLIALTHMGIYGEDEGSMKLAREISDFDLIIDGHSHTLLKKPITKIDNGSYNITPIVQAGQWGSFLGVAEVTFENGKSELTNWKAEAVNYNKMVKNEQGGYDLKQYGRPVEIDNDIKDMMKPYVEKANARLAKKIGTARDKYENTFIRKKETELGNLICDAMQWKLRDLKPDFTLNNGGGIRTNMPKGDVTLKNIFEILPFDNTVAMVTLTGSELKDLFDYIGEIKNGKGSFPQVSKEVKFAINYQTKTTSDILINGEPIDDSKEYKVVTNSYLMSGGDGYKVFKEAEKNYDSSVLQRDALAEYIEEVLKGDIHAKIEERIIINR